MLTAALGRCLIKAQWMQWHVEKGLLSTSTACWQKSAGKATQHNASVPESLWASEQIFLACWWALPKSIRLQHFGEGPACLTFTPQSLLSDLRYLITHFESEMLYEWNLNADMSSMHAGYYSLVGCLLASAMAAQSHGFPVFWMGNLTGCQCYTPWKGQTVLAHLLKGLLRQSQSSFQGPTNLRWALCKIGSNMLTNAGLKSAKLLLCNCTIIVIERHPAPEIHSVSWGLSYCCECTPFCVISMILSGNFTTVSLRINRIWLDWVLCRKRSNC